MALGVALLKEPNSVLFVQQLAERLTFMKYLLSEAIPLCFFP